GQSPGPGRTAGPKSGAIESAGDSRSQRAVSAAHSRPAGQDEGVRGQSGSSHAKTHAERFRKHAATVAGDSRGVEPSAWLRAPYFRATAADDIMDLAQAFIFDAGWFFFAVWTM